MVQKRVVVGGLIIAWAVALQVQLAVSIAVKHAVRSFEITSFVFFPRSFPVCPKTHLIVSKCDSAVDELLL